MLFLKVAFFAIKVAKNQDELAKCLLKNRYKVFYKTKDFKKLNNKEINIYLKKFGINNAIKF
jgi:hypothetical protein